MKKSAIAVLLISTLLFVAFVVGFYVGRNSNREPVLISGIPKYTFPITTTTMGPTEFTQPPTLDPQTIHLLAVMNAATLEDWDEVPNIGKVTAQAILDYRMEYGDFQHPEDLMRVAGIGEKTYKTIMEYFRGRLSNENSGS